MILFYCFASANSYEIYFFFLYVLQCSLPTGLPNSRGNFGPNRCDADGHSGAGRHVEIVISHSAVLFNEQKMSAGNECQKIRQRLLN